MLESSLANDYSVTADVTVTSHVSVFDPSFVVTVIITGVSGSVALTPVTTPLVFTVANSSLDEENVTVLSVAFIGATVAVSDVVEPTSTLTVLGAIVTPVTLMTGFVTVTVHSSFNPLLVVAVIFTVPDLTPVTLPEASTVAIALLSVENVTVLSSAFSGNTVATRDADFPTSNERVFLLRVMLVARTTRFFLQ